MTRVKLNLASGSVQEREVVTAFKINGVKYIIFDGESTGSMGLPIILVSREQGGKVVGITDAEEWKNTKETLKKIISGENVEYASVQDSLNADDVYYRQLTLPIASFDTLKSSYKIPEGEGSTAGIQVDTTPVFEPITPEDITGGEVPTAEPVAPSVFSAPTIDTPIVSAPVMPENITPVIPGGETSSASEEISAPVETKEENSADNKYEELKKEFLASAEKLFDELYEKLNH